MPKKKVAVAISDWLLEEVDEAASASAASRSSLVEEALLQYVTKRSAEKSDDEFRRRALAAIEDAKRIAREYASDPANANAPSSLEVLRQIRNEE